MPRFAIFEEVLEWTSYRKVVEADSEDAALAMAYENWSEIDADETGPFYLGDAIDVRYSVEPDTPPSLRRERKRVGRSAAGSLHTAAMKP